MRPIAAVFRSLALVGVIALLLMPTGVCLCGHGDEGAAEEHQPGCPEVRKLDRAAPSLHYTGDPTRAAVLDTDNDRCPTGPPRVVAQVSHGPPLGRPIYLTHQTLLI